MVVVVLVVLPLGDHTIKAKAADTQHLTKALELVRGLATWNVFGSEGAAKVLIGEVGDSNKDLAILSMFFVSFFFFLGGGGDMHSGIVYVYIYIERERERHLPMCIYIIIHYTYIIFICILPLSL